MYTILYFNNGRVVLVERNVKADQIAANLEARGLSVNNCVHYDNLSSIRCFSNVALILDSSFILTPTRPAPQYLPELTGVKA